MVVFLDTGVLGFLTNPSDSAEPIECKQWLDGILSGGGESESQRLRTTNSGEN
jgi:hypothetical protein